MTQLLKLSPYQTRDSNNLDLFFTTNPTLVKRVSTLQGISDHDIVQIQVNTSAIILFQKPRSISLYKKANWDGMKQALVAYYQDMLENGKYSYLEDILDVASNDLTSKPNTEKTLYTYKILPLLHLYANTIRSIRTTPRKPLSLMNSSSLL